MARKNLEKADARRKDVTVPKPPKAARPPRQSASRSLLGHSLFAIVLLSSLVGGSVLWASAANVSGAVMASGRVVVDGGPKLVQHDVGGIVSEILVRNEDEVKAGQVLVRLDGKMARAKLMITISQLNEALARQARLDAESVGETKLVPPAILDTWPYKEQLETELKAQQMLMDQRTNDLVQQDRRLIDQIDQLNQQIEGLNSQKQAAETQLGIVQVDLVTLQGLLKKGLTQGTRVTDSQREVARLQGEVGRLVAEIAGRREQITERETTRQQVAETFRTQASEDLQQVNVQIAGLLQQQVADEATVDRLDIRAPQSGVVYQSVVETIGGVVNPGQTLMQVVPKGNLVIDVKLSPVDIDKIYVGQPVVVKLSAFDARTTPDLMGKVLTIAPDLTVEQQTGQAYYKARVDIAASEYAKLPKDLQLVPGMPAEAFIHIGDRTVLAYLIKPLADQITRAFRED